MRARRFLTTIDGVLKTLRSPTQLEDAGATTTPSSDADHAKNLLAAGAFRQLAAQELHSALPLQNLVDDRLTVAQQCALLKHGYAQLRALL